MFLQNGTILSSQTVWRVTKSQAGSIYFVKFFIKKTLKTKNRILTKWDDIVVPNCVGLKFFGWLQIFVKTCGTIDNMGRHMSTLFFCSSPDACFVVVRLIAMGGQPFSRSPPKTHPIPPLIFWLGLVIRASPTHAYLVALVIAFHVFCMHVVSGTSRSSFLILCKWVSSWHPRVFLYVFL